MTPCIVLPIIFPLLAAATCVMLAQHRRWQICISLLSSTLVLLVGAGLLQTVTSDGLISLTLGEWPARYGINLIADRLSSWMVLMVGVLGLACTLYTIRGIEPQRARWFFYPVWNGLQAGSALAFLTGDLFNLYVAFEILLMGSFVLLAHGSTRLQLQGAVKYVVLNFLASTFFLSAAGILYGLTGTMNLALMGQTLAGNPEGGALLAALLLLLAFGIKSAVFPLFFWLPASYHTPPTPVSALFAGLLTKVGVYALIRVFTVVFPEELDMLSPLLAWCAGLTIIVGGLGALAQKDLKRTLCYMIVGHIGYMIAAISVHTALAYAAVLFFLVHDMLAKSCLFLTAGSIAKRTPQASDHGGDLWRRDPVLSSCFGFGAMDLAGLPPFSGFFAKLLVLMALFQSGAYALASVALIGAFLTLFIMARLWIQLCWEPGTAATATPLDTHPLSQRIPIAGLALLCLLVGLSAGPVINSALRAGEDLKTPVAYRQALLGDTK
ncbi:MAG: proton-conducting transporter membrane subunit [Kiritimatiellae bacterium]|nr:proton-conducting transporter membrane subunit [Kiritimatiellia bacterium]